LRKVWNVWFHKLLWSDLGSEPFLEGVIRSLRTHLTYREFSLSGLNQKAISSFRRTFSESEYTPGVFPTIRETGDERIRLIKCFTRYRDCWAGGAYYSFPRHHHVWDLRRARYTIGLYGNGSVSERWTKEYSVNHPVKWGSVQVRCSLFSVSYPLSETAGAIALVDDRPVSPTAFCVSITLELHLLVDPPDASRY